MIPVIIVPIRRDHWSSWWTGRRTRCSR
jgi:hypothetical protein